MLVTTGSDFAGHTIAAHLGIVRGLVVRTNNLVTGFVGGIKSIFGGNIREYETVCDDARQQAFERMTAQARRMGAHGIIAVRFDATEFSAGVTEVIAYGTAVSFTEPPPSPEHWKFAKDAVTGPPAADPEP